MQKASSIEIAIKQLKCLRCGHEWIPNKAELPRVCPSCHNPYWNKPKKAKMIRILTKRRSKVKSMFGVIPDLPPFEREEDDFRG